MANVEPSRPHWRGVADDVGRRGRSDARRDAGDLSLERMTRPGAARVGEVAEADAELVSSSASLAATNRDGSQTSPTWKGQPGAGVSAALPSVLGRLASGTFWVALRIPINAAIGFLTIPLIVGAIGEELNGAYQFAWGFGFFQVLLEFGMSSALSRRISEAWTQRDHEAVDRTVVCGLLFYAVMTLVQCLALLAVLHLALPLTDYQGEARELIVKLLWLQIVTAPCYGLGMILASLLQAARRYEVLPLLDLIISVLRFGVMVVALRAGVPFFTIMVMVIGLQIVLYFGPGFWVLFQNVGYRPTLRRPSREDVSSLVKFSAYVFILNLSMILADKVDTTVLGFALADPGPPTTVYQAVSKPFLSLRQMAWMLTGLLVPAVASLAAARDDHGLDRVKYDATRALLGVLLPPVLLAGLLAGPFLVVWMGESYRQHAGLMQLFLIAAAPLAISGLVQTAIGMGEIKFIAWTALIGAVINLPLSFVLTWVWNDVSGVIWGTVLTTLFSNLIAPGWYLWRRLEIDAGEFARRALSAPLAGVAALLVATLVLPYWVPLEPDQVGWAERVARLLLHIGVGLIAYAAGHLLTPWGRSDLRLLRDRLSARSASKQLAPADSHGSQPAATLASPSNVD